MNNNICEDNYEWDKDETMAYEWEITSIDRTGSFNRGRYICPCCKLENSFFIFNNHPEFVTSSKEFYFEDECACCLKKIRVICNWSNLKNPENIRVHAESWKRYLRNSSDHNEYDILVYYNCPFCNNVNEWTFKVQNSEFEYEHEYRIFHKCQFCGEDTNVVLDNSDKYYNP